MLITAALGGRPGMISGATGALAVVMVSLVVRHGPEYLFATVILMGLLQILFVLCKLGKFVRMVPHSVMLGFVNGLAIVIFFVQFGHFKLPGADGVAVWMSGPKLYLTVALTMAIIYLQPKLTTMVPSSLAATLIVAGSLPQFHLPQVPLNLDTPYIIFPYALILAAIGLIESLLTLNLIDAMTDTRGRPNRASMAQGIANVVSACFASMGGCAMIGQSMINIGNGARHRLSGIVAAFAWLGFILFLSRRIEMIPLAALVGLMFVVCQKTFAWSSLQALRKMPRQDAITAVGVTVPGRRGAGRRGVRRPGVRGGSMPSRYKCR